MTTPITTSFGTVAATAGTATTTKANGDLDKQTFLNLLVAQLRNQDPSSPMDTSQMMAQTTALSTMEKLTELADTQRESFALQMRMGAAELVGQQVTWTDDKGAEQTGKVSGVSYADPVPSVTVGTNKIALDAVSAVTASTTA